MKGLLKHTLPDTRAYAGSQGIDIYGDLGDTAIWCFISSGTRAPAINAMSLGGWKSRSLDKITSKLTEPPEIRYHDR